LFWFVPVLNLQNWNGFPSKAKRNGNWGRGLGVRIGGLCQGPCPKGPQGLVGGETAWTRGTKIGRGKRPVGRKNGKDQRTTRNSGRVKTHRFVSDFGPPKGGGTPEKKP